MHFLTLLPLVLFLALFAPSTSALPSLYRRAAAYEPLFRRAAPQVGPNRALERLRLRRKAIEYSAERVRARDVASTVRTNPKALAKRAAPVNVARTNPKFLSKRSTNPLVILNPKKRSTITSTVIFNPKMRRDVVVDPAATNSTTSDPASLASNATLVSDPNAAATNSTALPEMAEDDDDDCDDEEEGEGMSPTPNGTSTRFIPGHSSTSTMIDTSTFIVATSTSSYWSIASSATAISSSDMVSSSTPSSTSMAPSASSTSMASSTSTDAASSSSATSTSSSVESTSTDAATSSSSSSSSMDPMTSTSDSATSTSMMPTSTSTVESSTSSAPSAVATPTGWPSSGGMIAATYYADWEGGILAPGDVDMSKFDLIDFAFAVPTSTFGLAFTQDNSESLLDNLVTLAHAANTKVLISIGGWTASNFFSAAVSTAKNRKVFIKNIVALAAKHNVDGIDIDWEYPGTTGNTADYSVSDTANFLTFLTALKKALPVGFNRLSACVSQNAFIGADGSPIADVSAFSDVLDNILIMNYDVWGASATPGPNAPLSDACPNSNQPNANELSSIQTWTTAGMQASKILMGVPAYGYISSSSATTLVHKRSNAVASTTSVHRRWFEDGNKRLAKRKAHEKRAAQLAKRQTVIFCPGNHSGQPCAGITNQSIKAIPWSPIGNGSTGTNGTSSGGVFVPGAGVGKLGNGDLSQISGNQIEWYQMLSYAVIVKKGSKYVGTNGYTRAWDACSSTPYLYDTSRSVVITYDDPESMQLKGAMAKAQGIGGVNMWDIGGDSKGWILTNAWRAGLGLAA